MSIWDKLSKLTSNEPSKYAFKISLKNEPLIMPLNRFCVGGGWREQRLKCGQMFPNPSYAFTRLCYLLDVLVVN